MSSQKFLCFAVTAIAVLLLMQPVAAASLRDVFGAFVNFGRSDQEALAYDFDGNGVVNFGDVVHILQEIFGLGGGRIECSSNAECGIITYSSPYCDGSNLMYTVTDYACINPGTTASSCDTNTTALFYEFCPSGCVVDDNCLAAPSIACYQDSDCGTGLYCDGNALVDYSCLNPGTVQSFCQENQSTMLCYECVDGICHGICSEGDGGQNYSVKGTTSGFISYGAIPYTLTDYCVGDEGVVEFYCGIDVNTGDVNAALYNDFHLCDNNCSDGACSGEITCYQDSDCGTELYCDGNALVDYSCLNPGTVQSFCQENPSTMLCYECVDGICHGICSESDSGANYSVKGTTSGFISYGAIPYTLTDHCAGDDAVMEFYCGIDVNTGDVNAALYNDFHLCDNNNCLDGACS